MPKGQDQGGALDRLRRRIDSYRKRHEEVVPRFENTISSQNQQQKQDTLLLRQRFLETNKTKKSAKKSEKKQHSDNVGSSVGSSKSNKRQNEDDQNADGYEPPSKIGGAGRGNSSPLPSNSTNPSLYKQSFSQNGKRGGNKAKTLDSQKYTASSSNLPKNGIGRVAQPSSSIPPNSTNFPQCNATQLTNPASEFKKESSATSISDFADLDQCAAALEQDAAKNGAITGGFMGENSTDDIFNSEVLNDLLSEISDLNPDVMSNIYLDDGPPPTADDLNDVTLHGSGAPQNGSCSTSDSFHPVTPITPVTASPMRPTNSSHGHHSGIKMEGNGGGDGTTLGVHSMDRGLSHCAGPSPAPASTASPLASQLGASSSHQPSPSQSYSGSHFVLDNGQTGSPLNSGMVNNGNTLNKPSTRLPYSSPAGLAVDSPAAQTLKHMAEQHQHKAQMCMNTTSTTNGGVQFKSQGSVGSPAGSPYGPMGSYNGNMGDYQGSTGNMNPTPNCQVKQEVCSPGNPQAGFSPNPMMVDMAAAGKRPGQHNGSSPQSQSSRIPNINSAGGSPIMSPISKSFNHPSPLNANNSQGQMPQQPPPQQQQQSQPPNYMPMNRLPCPSQPYPNANPRFPSPSASQISVASPKSAASNQGHVSDRGSPATQMDSKPQLRHNVPNPNMQQQHQQQQFASQQFHYGNGQNPNMPVEMGFNSANHPPNSQMQPQSQQQQGSGQTINFTQQHLRMGNQPGIPPQRLPMPPMNRLGVPPQRIQGNPMQEMQQQVQQRPHMDPNLPQRMMPRQPRHNMMPQHQQMQMGGMPPQQQQMGGMGNPNMGNQMGNRFAGMPNNPQMMSQQQAYGMGSNMQMGGPPNPNMMPIRRPYGPGPGFQGMSRAPGDQMLSTGSQNSHPSMSNSGVPHNDWMGNMNSMSDGPCPPYSGPQRHPVSQQQMRPSGPPQQYHPGVPQNQGGSVSGPQMGNNFGQSHEHMMAQQGNFNMGVSSQNHSQQQMHHHQQQQSSQQQIPPNFSQHPGGPNAMKMGMPNHHPQQQMYGNANNGFPPMKSNEGMMCAPPNSMSHHPQMQQQVSQQSQQMYNMGNNMMNNVGAQGQMNNNNNMMSDQQDFNLDLLVDGMRGSGDQVDASFNEDLLNTLDSVFP